MTKFRIILILILTVSSVSFSQIRSDSKVKKGLEAIYNFNFTAGKEIFKNLIVNDPESPVGYHYYSLIPMWYYLGSYNTEYLDTFFMHSDSALNLAKEIEIKDSLTAELAFIISSIYANRSIVNARAGNYVYAVWESDRMKHYSLKALELDESFYDAYTGLALYNLAVAQIPSALQWALQLVGVEADHHTGIESLQTVLNKGLYAKTDAQFYLSQVYTRVIIDYREAEKLIKKLTQRFPKNLLFKFSYAWLEAETGKVRSAYNKFSSIIASEQENFRLLKVLSHYQMGNINFYEGHLDSAIYHYKKYLDLNTENDYNGIVNLYLGLSFELSGLRDSSIVYYENSSDGNSDLDEDSFAKRIGNELVNDSLSAQQIRMIKLKNLFYTARYKAAIDSLKYFIEDSLQADIKAEALLFIARAYYNLNNYNEAINFAVQSIQTDIQVEKWIQPFALYISAESSFQLKNYLDSKLFLDLISEYSDYDFSLKLNGLCNSLRIRLSKIDPVVNK